MEHIVVIFLIYLCGVGSYSVSVDIETPPLNTLYKWKSMFYIFTSRKHRQEALQSGLYNPDSVMPFGLDVWGDRIFLTLPAWRPGVPATLATVPKGGGHTSPPLNVYPDWSYHRNDNYDLSYVNCTGIVSAIAINIDPCGKLWVLDSGQIDSHDEPKQMCLPSILIFDLNTDQLLKRYDIPNKHSKPDSFYTNIVIDTRSNDCSDAHAYITDTHGFGLLVFRRRDAKFWRFNHHLFYPDPDASNFDLNGLNFQWTDGIFAVSLGRIDENDDRYVYIHALSSFREIYVKASVIRNPLKVNSKREFHFFVYERGTLGQASASIVDKRGVMFFGLISKFGVACWDTKKNFEKYNQEIVVSDTDTLNFVSDLKVDKTNNYIYVMSNKLPQYRERRMRRDDFKYRIFTADAFEIVRGTACDPESPEITDNTTEPDTEREMDTVTRKPNPRPNFRFPDLNADKFKKKKMIVFTPVKNSSDIIHNALYITD